MQSGTRGGKTKGQNKAATRCQFKSKQKMKPKSVSQSWVVRKKGKGGGWPPLRKSGGGKIWTALPMRNHPVHEKTRGKEGGKRAREE